MARATRTAKPAAQERCCSSGVEHFIGNEEVGSSNLPSSTILQSKSHRRRSLVNWRCNGSWNHVANLPFIFDDPPLDIVVQFRRSRGPLFPEVVEHRNRDQFI